MKITVDRFLADSDTTISRVLIDGVYECFGLEDEFRTDKVMHETRIPAGTYKIGARTVGGFHARYSDRYGDWHRGMLHILDVPKFEYILIHCGNTDENTSGCLLVGSSANTAEGDMSIGSSRAAYKQFYPKVIEAAVAGSLEIEFIDSDR